MLENYGHQRKTRNPNKIILILSNYNGPSPQSTRYIPVFVPGAEKLSSKPEPKILLTIGETQWSQRIRASPISISII